MRELYRLEQFDVDIIGINYTGDPYDYERFPFRVFPAVTIATIAQNPSMDVYGREKFLKRIAEGNYDVIFILQDTFIVQTFMDKMLEVIGGLQHRPKTILYYPIDAAPDPAWITDVVAKIDYAVPYTNYAATQTLLVGAEFTGKLTDPIYHGTNTKEFHYVEDREVVKQFRHEWFDRGLADDRFVMMNLNRNQPRKDIFRSLQVLKCLRELGDNDTLLYLHMSYQDAGGNIVNQAEQLGLELGKDFVLPHPRVFSTNQGVDIETLNMIYNAVDCVMSTTHGEGWGLSVTEAFATRTPVVVPNNTSLTEMCAKNRGKLVDCGDSNEAWIVRQDDNDRVRPIVNVDKFAKAIIEVRSGKDLPNIEAAEAWAHEHSWENICQKWGTLFTTAGQSAQAETKQRLLDEEKKAQFKKGVSKKQRRKAKR